MESAPGRTHIAVIGECLIELCGAPFGTLHQSFGGDTLNTAVYLARLLRHAASIAYATAIGSDSLSDAMLERWQAEGLDTSLALRDPARLPGLYQIEVDEHGERRFLYWRQESAARYLLRHDELARVRQALSQVDLIYLSAISMAILPTEDRARLIDLLSSLAARGIPIAFDTNYRDSLWSSPQSARAAMSAAAPASHFVFATFDDERRLWGDQTPDDTLARYRGAGVASVIIKLGPDGCLYGSQSSALRFAAEHVPLVVDTTAAGDSFNAAFLAAWLSGRSPQDCCRIANALAAIVIQHRGAIIPATATPSLEQLLAEGLSGGKLSGQHLSRQQRA
jgi:2-dehydro-3-deoxygluconokinase